MARFNQIILCTAILTAGLFASCNKDQSTDATRQISTITTETTLDSIYSRDRLDILTLTAPEVKQANGDKPLSYSWEIGGKVVSTEKTLSYECTEFGTFEGRLKISNEDGARFLQFKLDVRQPYSTGLYILASQDGESIISYYPEGLEGKEFTLDAYKKNNPSESLGANPKGFILTSSRYRTGFYVATGTTKSTVHRIDPNSMIELQTASPANDREVTYISAYPSETVPEMIMSGMYVTYSDQGGVITYSTNKEIRELFSDSFLASDIAYWNSPISSARKAGALVFDNTGGHLIALEGSKVEERLAGRFTGKTLLGIETVNGGEDVFLVLQNSSNELSWAWLYPGYFSSSRQRRETVLKKQGTIPSTSELTAESILKASAVKNFLYYSNENKIYVYNILSEGNFPTSATFTYDSGETVADILVMDSSSRLYVATNSSTGTLKGNIYCYDLNSNQLLWQQKGLTGEVRQLLYRTNS